MSLRSCGLPSHVLLILVVFAVLALARSFLAGAERASNAGIARGIGITARGAGGDLLPGDRRRLADYGAAGATHQVDVDVIVVIDVGARRQHGVELLAGRALHVAQKSLLLGQAMPAVFHCDAAAVGEREGSDVERISERMLGNVRVGIAVHAATGI